MTKFLQIAIQSNKIQELNNITTNADLFEYIELQEESKQYCNYIIGDLVLVQRYRYKNGKMGFYHIFLIVDLYTSNDKILYFGMLLSSKIEKISYKPNKLILKDSQNNLKKDSIVKTDVIYKIFTQNILLKIGNIDKTKVEIYKNYLINNKKH